MEDYYRKLFEYSGAPLAVVQADRVLSKVNRAFEELTGYSRKEAEGKLSLQELMASDQLEDLYQKGILEEIPLSRKDGRQRIVEAVIKPIPETQQFLLSVIDLTEKTRTREPEEVTSVGRSISSQLELQDLLKKIVETTAEAMGAKLCTIRMVEGGELTEGVAAGYRNSDLRNHRIKINGRLKDIVYRHKPLAIKDLHKYSFPSPQRLQRMGNLRSYLGVPVVSRGQTIAILSIYRDNVHSFSQTEINFLSTIAGYAATALENARLYKEIKETKDYLKSIVDSSVDAIISTDQKGFLTFFSKGAECILGYKREEAIGRPASDFFLNGAKEVQRIYRMLKREGTIQNYETELITKEGNTISISLSASPLKNEKGEIMGILGISKDITERKKAEKELQQRKEELESLIYSISHDLKAPVASLEGYSSLLLEEYKDKLDAEGRHYLERMKKNINQMTMLIQDLLELSRIGKMMSPPKEVPASEIIQEVLDELRFQIEKRGIELVVAENLPSIYCDRKRMEIVFSNLIDNSIKYMGDTQDPKIEIGYEDKGDVHLFFVKDNGIGIEEKYHDKIFVLFQRLHDLRDVEGTGVGLTIVKKIIESHHGTITVSSQKGKGATFFFTLPKRGSISG